jgi:hypothetical protein
LEDEFLRKNPQTIRWESKLELIVKKDFEKFKDKLLHFYIYEEILDD